LQQVHLAKLSLPKNWAVRALPLSGRPAFSPSPVAVERAAAPGLIDAGIDFRDSNVADRIGPLCAPASRLLPTEYTPFM
jgi:hypothetical protein